MMLTHDDEYWMHHALRLAQHAQTLGEVPVGAVLISAEGVMLAEGWNQSIACHDPTSHAEVMALRRAGQVCGNYRLLQTTLYVTLEPCAMCVGAMVHARIKRLVFGAFDPKGGCVHSVMPLLDAAHLNHRVVWEGGVLADTCGEHLRQFFAARR